MFPHLNEANVVFQVTGHVKSLVGFEAEGGDVLLVGIGHDERIGAHSHSHVDRLQSVLHSNQQFSNQMFTLTIFKDSF